MLHASIGPFYFFLRFVTPPVLKRLFLYFSLCLAPGLAADAVKPSNVTCHAEAVAGFAFTSTTYPIEEAVADGFLQQFKILRKLRTAAVLQRIFFYLPPYDKHVLFARFGLDGKVGRSYRLAGLEMGVTKEGARVRVRAGIARIGRIVELGLHQIDDDLSGRESIAQLNLSEALEADLMQQGILYTDQFRSKTRKEIQDLGDVSKGVMTQLANGLRAAGSDFAKSEAPINDSIYANLPVSNLRLGKRGRAILVKLNITTLGGLAARTAAEILQHPNVGEGTIQEMWRGLKDYGLELAQ